MMDFKGVKITIFTAFTCLSALMLGAQQQQPQAQAVPLASFTASGETSPRQNVRAGRQSSSAWITTDKSTEFYLKPQGKKWPVAENGDLFMQLAYLDAEYGRIRAEVEMESGKKFEPYRHSQIYMLKSGQFKTAYFKFANIPGDSIKHIKIRIDQTQRPVLAIAKAAVSDEAKTFGNGYFVWLVNETWRRPYDGPVVLPKDNKTLKGKVMCGYQGWFATPNDALDRGWVHWGDIPRQRFSFEAWPYQNDYPQDVLDKANDVKTISGKPAYLFSSARPEVVITHFKWMQKYNLDGVWLQRFVGSIGYAFDGREEWVMGCVREAANRTGRLWGIEYDVSGGGAENRYVWGIGVDVGGGMEQSIYERISTDWKWLIDDFGIREDKSYVREGGKPAVFVWGMELRNLSIEECDRVVNFLKHDPKYGGNYFVGGMSGGWKNKPDWHDHLRSNDALLIWQSGRYEEDIKDFERILPGVEYYAHAHPGFSWANLKHIQTNSYVAYTDREDGAFLEKRIARAADAGSKMLFIGMLDEYDEATQILPMSDDPPHPPRRPGAVVFFGNVTNSEHKPPFQLKEQVYFKFDGSAPDKGVRPNDFFMNWECSIEIPTDGDYKFWLEGPEGDRYKIRSSTKEYANEPNIDPHLPPREAVFKDLKKGFLLPLQIEYWHKGKRGEMKLMWEGPRIKSQQVPMKHQNDAWGRFIVNNGKSPFLYLEIAAKAKELMKKNLK